MNYGKSTVAIAAATLCAMSQSAYATHLDERPASFVEWILRQRLARARTLLRETSLPLDQIAAQYGFCHAANLSNLFHRETGLSTRAFRRLRGSELAPS